MSATTTGFFSLPVFLTPAYSATRLAPRRVLASRSFSSTANNKKQNKKNGNKQRGVSALRSTGPRTKLSIDRYPLPQPVKNPEALRAEFPTNTNHGLYQFFNTNKESLISPSDESSHGRSWSHNELEKKSFDDLWKLHWACVKEANQVATRDNERRRVYAGYGDQEAEVRMSTIKATMRRIRQVLIRRHDDRTNALALLNMKNLNEIFPDAEAELGFNAPESTSDSENATTNIRETPDLERGPEHLGMFQTESKDDESIPPEQPNRRRRRQLTE